MIERAVLFGRDRTLVGIITEPFKQDVAANSPAIILLNAGLAHRVGPNRVYVTLARSLCRQGFTVLRFDFSGIGDSSSSTTDAPYLERSVREVLDAMEFLSQSKGMNNFVLAGICTGAEVALATTVRTSKVVAAVLINGGFDNVNQTRADSKRVTIRSKARYYFKKIYHVRNWSRFFTGKSDYRTIVKTALQSFRLFIRVSRSSRTLNDLFGGQLSLIERNGSKVLVIVAEGSWAWDVLTTAQFIQLESPEQFQIELIEDCDHTFTQLWSQDKLAHTIADWLVRSNSQPRLAEDSNVARLSKLL